MVVVVVVVLVVVVAVVAAAVVVVVAAAATAAAVISCVNGLILIALDFIIFIRLLLATASINKGPTFFML